MFGEEESTKSTGTVPHNGTKHLMGNSTIIDDYSKRKQTSESLNQIGQTI